MSRHGTLESHLIHKVQILVPQVIQAVQILHIRHDGHLMFRGIKADHGFKKIPLALLDHLAQRVEIRRQFRSGRENALALLTLGFAEELLPPAAEHPEAGIKSFKNFHRLALPVQQIPHRGIKPHGIFIGTEVIFLLGIHGTVHQFHDVDARHCHGQKANGGQHGKPSAHGRRNVERLPALFPGHLPQSALKRIGHRVNAAVATVGAVFPLQHPSQATEGDGRLRGSAGLGNDDDGKILAFQQSHQFVPVPGAQIVAGKINLGITPALIHIVIGTLEQFDGRSGAQVRAANAHHHAGIGLVFDLVRRLLDPLHLFGGFPHRQIQPAKIVASRTGTLGESLMGVKNFLFHGQQIAQGNFAPYIGNIHSDHRIYDTSFPFSLFCVSYFTVSPLQRQGLL